jgi:hypothetical protein
MLTTAWYVFQLWMVGTAHTGTHSVRIKVNDSGEIGEQMLSLIYFEVKLNLERKTDELIRRTKNCYTFYQIIKGILWNREIPKQQSITHFKLVLTYYDVRAQTSRIKRDAC